jgi:translation initiation factor 2B subunit (eIF-2B alpha/beta/delta family)
MLRAEVFQLAGRFEKLELHAAHSGREVLRVLQGICEKSRSQTTGELAGELYENAAFLLVSLPPYAPPLNRINQVLLAVEAGLKRNASLETIKQEIAGLGDAAASPRGQHEEIARHLLAVLPRDAVIYTHTLSETVLGVLLQLCQAGGVRKVIVTESRPNNDGWVTAQRLSEAGMPVELTIDAAMPSAVERADLMLSGAEIINADGSVVGKVGAYAAAVLCEWQAKPLYIVADSSKISALPWRGLKLAGFGPEGMGLDFQSPCLAVTGTYFDITPANLIRAYATERGLLTEDEVIRLASQITTSPWLAERLGGTSPLAEKESNP